MSLRTPLAAARGLGSAKEGVEHWWKQRLTAIALVPLLLWFGFSVALLGTADYYTVMGWLAHPVNAGLMILVLSVGLWHGMLGLQVVIEDYIATEWKKITVLLLVQFASVILALAGILAVLRIALGV
ncbi:succinate dehydrogenase, hydrophobic membrane anchor protein [Halofilum ochraceum]|uniref:succinate dehydrogenase, hydrophobic membrane anchor protein n=1 Tax=Halofilum ochraceum TaxID=1611323 RepID=UPI0008348A9B|nr:succinate dehydrogenase, hydrophobic membrane anchor protein [Halofilum ochraceum]